MPYIPPRGARGGDHDSGRGCGWGERDGVWTGINIVCHPVSTYLSSAAELGLLIIQAVSLEPSDLLGAKGSSHKALLGEPCPVPYAKSRCDSGVAAHCDATPQVQ